MDLMQRCQLEVETLVGGRGDLASAEELIDQVEGLSQDEKAALWLYAWSLLPRRKQLKAARAHLAALPGLSGT